MTTLLTPRYLNAGSQAWRGVVWGVARKLVATVATLACAACMGGVAGTVPADARGRDDPSAWRKPGLHELAWPVDGRERTALLYLPRSWQSQRPAALVYVLHGGGGWAGFMADDDRYGWLAQAERAGFILVFPSGYSKWPGGRLATWHAGGCCGDARDRGVDDVAYMRALHQRITAQLPVDAGKVFATGMSNGGMMSYRLACEWSDVLAAVAPVAGTDATLRCQPARPVSVLHIHARDDTHVLFNGGAGPDAFRDRSKVMDFVSVPQTVARWVGRQHCEGTPRRTLSAPGAQCDAHAACDGGTTVSVCVTEAGGHSWPGTAAPVRRGKGQPSQALRATEVIWQFFEAHSR